MGDVILDTDEMGHVFQSFPEIESIFGNLVIANLSVYTFSAANLAQIGCSGNQTGTLVFRNNPNLKTIRLRRLKSITMGEGNQYSVEVSNCPKLQIDALQFEVFKLAVESRDSMKIGGMLTYKYYRSVLTEMTPIVIFATCLFIAFVWHFAIQENCIKRLKIQENEYLTSLLKMRNAILASELLVQTPCDEMVTFDQPVLQKQKLNNQRRDKINEILNIKFSGKLAAATPPAEPNVPPNLDIDK